VTADESTPVSADESKPLFRVVRGNPDDAELAGLTAVVAALASTPAAPAAPVEGSAWGDPARRVRNPLRHGPGAWRASSRPQ
jgi:hypothetical protein